MMGGVLGAEWPAGGPGYGLAGLGLAESPHCALLHSGRAAWECLLRAELQRAGSALREVLVPRFTCQTVLEPLRRLGLGVRFYAVSEQLEPEVLPQDAAEAGGSLLLLTDYFGLRGEMVRRVAQAWGGPVVVDATMALFGRYGASLPAFYSLRKFVGVADGGVAWAPAAQGALPLPEQEARSAARALFLLERLEDGAEGCQASAQWAEDLLSGPPMRMSPLTRCMLQGVDMERVAAQRRANYALLHAALHELNHLQLPADPGAEVPFCYPFVSGIPGLRDELIDAGVVLPLLWPEVIEQCPAESAENRLARRLLPLPLDQRYGEADMLRLINLIRG